MGTARWGQPRTPAPHCGARATLWCRRRKGSSMSIPPSWTIHQTSMWPSENRSWLPGNMATFLATSKARCPAVVSRTSSGRGRATSARVAHSPPPTQLYLPSAVPTDEVPPGLVVLLLAPAAGPAHQHRVVLQPPQPAGLDEVGHAVPQVGGDHHLAKALHLLRFHQAADGLVVREGGQRSQAQQPPALAVAPWPGRVQGAGTGCRLWGAGPHRVPGSLCPTAGWELRAGGAAARR